MCLDSQTNQWTANNISKVGKEAAFFHIPKAYPLNMAKAINKVFLLLKKVKAEY